MSSRVTTSANLVLGLEKECNARSSTHYEELAIELGQNPELYNDVRNRLIATCLQRNPMHPYWDVPRYVKNFSRGLQLAWQRYLEGKEPDHIHVQEDATTREGTYDHVLLEHPPEGPLLRNDDENGKPKSRAQPVQQRTDEL